MRYSSRILPILIIVAAAATFTFAGCKKKDMSLKLNEPRNIRGVVSYKRSFGDLNEKHLNVAQAIGIRALSSREEAEKMRGATATYHDERALCRGFTDAFHPLSHSGRRQPAGHHRTQLP